MGFMLLHAFCAGCQMAMTCNAERVPSITVEGTREPVCASCIRKMQARQREAGEEVWPDPHPDAYEPQEVY